MDTTVYQDGAAETSYQDLGNALTVLKGLPVSLSVRFQEITFAQAIEPV